MTVLFPYNQIMVDNFIIDATDTGAGNDKWTSTTVQTYRPGQYQQARDGCSGAVLCLTAQTLQLRVSYRTPHQRR
jgi:hypothetical protein